MSQPFLFPRQRAGFAPEIRLTPFSIFRGERVDIWYFFNTSPNRLPWRVTLALTKGVSLRQLFNMNCG